MTKEGTKSRAEASLAVTWLGHACALIELDGVRVLSDPIMGNRVGPLVRIGSPPPAEPFRGVDAALVSHLHADHADLRSLRKVGARVIAPRGSARWLARHGLREVEELQPGEATSVGSVRVTATPAAHEGRRWRLGSDTGAIGFVLSGSQTCYFAGDTDLYDAMRDLAGSIDIALLPVWGWGPRLGPGHLDPERAARAVAMIVPRVAVPIHWGTFALGWPARAPGDPSLPARRFAELVARRTPSVEVRLLQPGARTQLTAAGAPPRGRWEHA